MKQIFGIFTTFALLAMSANADQAEISVDRAQSGAYLILKHETCPVVHEVVNESVDRVYINNKLVGQLDATGDIGVMVGSEKLGVQLFDVDAPWLEATSYYIDQILAEHNLPEYDQLATFVCHYS